MSLARPRERRGEYRLFNQAVGTRVPVNGEMLLNVSRSGLAVGIRNRCTFARGEHYRVTLDDGKRRADLEGTVCWTRSTWPQESTGSNGGEYFQAAGLAIDDSLPTEQQEHWRALRELVQEGWVALDVKVLPVR